MTGPEAGEPWGLYVHVPWCRVRCPYCAFHVDPDRGDAPWEAFSDRVAVEVETLRPLFPGPLHTLYLGGGTPSRAPPPILERLLALGSGAMELTLEANPEDLDAAYLDAALSSGVTRVSLGVQSLATAQARKLGRAHTPAEGRAAARLLAQSGVRSWSLDLMFALPHQTLADVLDDLDAMLSLDPPHVSLYGLTYEAGTPFGRAAARGKILETDEGLWADMYGAIVERLEAAGRPRYEVSNFARPGQESEHNRGYWRDRPYMGVGPSAHGYAPDGRRWVDRADTSAWMVGGERVRAWETPTPDQAATDMIISGLRSVDGLDLLRLARRTHRAPSPSAVAKLAHAGLVDATPDRLRLGPAGWMVADGVASALADDLLALDPAPSKR